MILLELLQIVGLVCGVLGAVLVTGRTCPVRAAGFASWVVGNAAWVWYAVLTESLYLGLQFGIFWMLAVAGLLNNLRDSRGGPDVVERHC